MSPLATSARRSSLPVSRSSDCSRSTVCRSLSISRLRSNGLNSSDRASFEISMRVRATALRIRRYGRFLRLRHALQLGRLLQRDIVQVADLVEHLQRLLGLLLDLFFGQLFVVELNDFLDRPRALAQILARPSPVP